MFITAFEILKGSIIENIRNFYIDEFKDGKSFTSANYQSHVLSKGKSPLYASLNWLRECEAIDDDDLTTFEQLKNTRDILAHKLFNVVTGDITSTHETQYSDLVTLLHKIDLWWIVNYEIPLNPDIDKQYIDESGIVPSSVLMLNIIIQVASGNLDFLEQYRSEQSKHR